jgi:glc operon protein GlcG
MSACHNPSKSRFRLRSLGVSIAQSRWALSDALGCYPFNAPMTTHDSKSTPTAAPPPGLPPQYGPPISLDLAKRVVGAAEAFAKSRGWPVVIAVFDSTGHLAVLHRLDQSNLGAVELAQRKAETAVRFRRPTKAFEEIIAGGGLRLLSVASEIIALEGGLPLLRDGQVIGSIGVSGLSSAEDAQVAQAGANAL